MAHGTGNEAEICHMASTRPPSASQSSSQSCPFPSRWGWPLTLSRTPSQSAPSMYLSNRSSLPHSGIASLPAMSWACCGCGVLSLFASSKPPPSFIPSFPLPSPPMLMTHQHQASPRVDVDYLPIFSAAPRQRTAVACRYCRRRKIRCSGFESSADGRCVNCIRFNQQCVFTPIIASDTITASTSKSVTSGASPDGNPSQTGMSPPHSPPPAQPYMHRTSMDTCMLQRLHRDPSK